jgi:hypothetical protein
MPLSVVATYYIPGIRRTAGLSPYASGGVTWLKWLTETGHDRGYNVGAGMILWGEGRHGLRLEFRDVFRPAESFTVRGRRIDVFPTRHAWSVNIGAAFR